jgi:hypothetical protein
VYEPRDSFARLCWSLRAGKATQEDDGEENKKTSDPESIHASGTSGAICTSQYMPDSKRISENGA